MKFGRQMLRLGTLIMMCGVGFAASPDVPGGDWYGTLHLENGDIHLIVDLKLDETGASGTLRTGDESGRYALSDVVLSAGHLSFRLEKYHTQYQAQWSDAAHGWVGKMSGGFDTDFTLVRKADYPGTRPQVPRPPLPYVSIPVTFHDGGASLAGTLTEPQGQGPFPSVVLIPAMHSVLEEETAAGHPSMAVLADYLTRCGMAVLRYDKRGTGKSPGAVHATTMTDQISDATAALSFLRARPEVSATRVGLIGHDVGGMQAAAVASQDPSVAFVVLLATPAVSGGKYFLRSTHDLAMARNALSAEDRQSLGVHRMDVNFIDVVYGTLTGIVQNAASRAKGMAVAAKYLRAAHAPDAMVKHMVQQFFAMDFYTLLRFDPRGELQALRCPVLALSGDKDVRLNPDLNQTALTNALANDPDAVVEMLPRLNHILQPANTGLPEEYSDFDTTMAPKALKRISGWISRALQPAQK